jgi:hypothetical protein
MYIKDLHSQERSMVTSYPHMYMQRHSDSTNIINKYQVIENVYKFCIKYDIHVRYPCDYVKNNQATYVINPSIIEIGNITNLKYAVNNIICRLFSILEYQKKNCIMTEIQNEIC